MAKFDVFRLTGASGYVLDCQADLLDHLNTRFVVPLVALADAPKPAARLNPSFEVEGAAHVMVTQFAAAVMRSQLGEQVASLKARDIEITNALDMLISGF